MFAFQHKAIPGFKTSFLLSWFYVLLIIVLPLAYLFVRTFDQTFSDFLKSAFDARALQAYKLTLICALIASFINLCIGLLLAWVLERYEFFGKRFLDALVDLPFAMPTTVAGLALLTLYDKQGWLGHWLNTIEIDVAYTMLGIILAMMFTSIPFSVRAIQPVLGGFSKRKEEAALILGASDFQVFCHVIFPAIRLSVFSGFILSLARSIGEYGAIVFIAGNIPFETEVASFLILVRLDEYDYIGASNIAFILLCFSILLLVGLGIFERREKQ